MSRRRVDNAHGALELTYIGHATLLLQFGVTCLLTDPNFDDTLGRFLPRVSPPGMAMAELPRVDAIVISHAHADHLSFRTLRALPSGIAIHAPPAVASWLRREGFAGARDFPPNASITIGDVTITSAPAKHAGARYVLDLWRGAAQMYLFDDGVVSVLFTGDTALTPVARTLAQRIAPRRVDVALIPVGFAPWWKRWAFRRGHLTPEDALVLFEQVNARTYVPFHWGTFRHVTSGAHDAIRVLRSLLTTYGRASQVRILEPGQSLTVREARA